MFCFFWFFFLSLMFACSFAFVSQSCHKVTLNTSAAELSGFARIKRIWVAAQKSPVLTPSSVVVLSSITSRATDVRAGVTVWWHWHWLALTVQEHPWITASWKHNSLKMEWHPRCEQSLRLLLCLRDQFNVFCLCWLHKLASTVGNKYHVTFHHSDKTSRMAVRI